MVDGVIMRMNNQTSLSTVALLSTLWEKERRDYLDVLAQFVLRCLPNKPEAQVDIDAITEKLRSEYGFDDIPHHVVVKVLRRLSRASSRDKRYLRRENRNYYVVDVYDGQGFDAARQETNALISDVLAALVQYLERNHLYKTVSIDDASGFLFHFFDTYGLTVVHDSSLLRGVTTANGSHNFYVARFVLENYEKKTPIFDKLLRITTGFLIHKAVYFYSAEMKSSVDSKLRDVAFYLDCSLVLDALGYDDASSEQAFDEMSQLIRTNGGKILVFQHTAEEASRVIEAYAHRHQSHNSFSLEGLDKRNYPSEVLASLATQKSIEENLRKKGIVVCDAPPYEATRIVDGKPVYEGFEDELAIERELQQYVKRRKGILNGDRMRYDAKTLSAIGRIRKGRKPSSIETCKAMLITQGKMLNVCMRNAHPSRFPAEIDFTIKDLDLVSLLWLGQQNKESQLPKNLLIANAVASCKISQDIMDDAIELACRMEQDKSIPSEAALIVRSQAVVRTLLFEKTHNNPALVTEDTIKNVIADYVTRESREEAEAAVAKAVDANTAKLKREHSIELEKVTRERDDAYSETRQRAIEMRNDAEQIANRRAALAKKCMECLVLAIWLALLVGSVYCWYKGGLVLTNIPAITLSILGLLQIIDYLFKVVNLKERLSGLAHDWVFAAAYTHEIRKREEISHISLSL